MDDGATPGAGAGAAQGWDALADLAANEAVAALFDDADARATLLAAIKDAGAPAPLHHIVFFCLKKAVFGAAGFLGGRATARLAAFAQKFPALRSLRDKLLGLAEQARSRGEARAALRAGLSAEALAGAGEDADLSVLQALYLNERLDDLVDEEGLRALLDEMRHGVRDDLKQALDAREEPALAWVMQENAAASDSPVDRITYTAGIFDLHGREDVLALLHAFLGRPAAAIGTDGFRWLLMTGEAGEGKTRLAVALTQQARDGGWAAGPLTLDDLARFRADRWRPSRPTLLIIDYPALAAGRLNRLLIDLTRRARDFDFPVRLLLLERAADGEWFKAMLPADASRASLIETAFAVEGSPRPKEQGLALPPLAHAAIVALMQERLDALGAPPPDDPRALVVAAHRVDPRRTPHDDGGIPIPRALFAAAAAEVVGKAMVEEGLSFDEAAARFGAQEDILAYLIEREREKRWAPAAKGKHPHTLPAHEALLALATACLGLPHADLAKADADLWAAARLPQEAFGAPVPLDDGLYNVMAGADATAFPALEPDLLGEYFVLDTLQRLKAGGRAPAAQALIDLAFALGGDRTAVFLLRCRRDLPQRLAALDHLAPSPAGGAATTFFFARAAVDLAAALAKGADWSAIDAVMARLAALQAASPQAADIALTEAEAAFNVTSAAGAAGDWPRVEAMLDRLDRLRRAFPDSADIALEEAAAAFNVTSDAGRAGDWPRVDAMLDRLDRLRRAFPDSADIALREAKAAVNVTHHAGAAGDRPRVDAMLDRLDRLRRAFPDSADIALEEAKAAVNVTHHAGAAGDRPRVEAMARRSAALETAFPQSAEIHASVAAQRVAAHHHRRTQGEDATAAAGAAAAQAAGRRLAASQREGSDFAVGACLMIIKDARRLAPADADVAALYAALEKAGVDFAQLPDYPDAA
ncbi:MAG: hypothetical protein RIB45_16990 [Marivibrio sp.]|uniref:hypothetical protein n=1 Tax=Marivibrio sp. TaxID=2039719 RepID=UPI0032ECCADC